MFNSLDHGRPQATEKGPLVPTKCKGQIHFNYNSYVRTKTTKIFATRHVSWARNLPPWTTLNTHVTGELLFGGEGRAGSRGGERRAGERKGGKRREVGRKWEKREGFAPVIKIFAGAVFLDFAVVRAMCGSTTNRGGQQGHCCHCFNFLILVFKANQRPIMCRNILSKHFAPYFSVICNHSMKC